jgi:hypothetical protein
MTKDERRYRAMRCLTVHMDEIEARHGAFPTKDAPADQTEAGFDGIMDEVADWLESKGVTL